jgi:hypothetical protein
MSSLDEFCHQCKYELIIWPYLTCHEKTIVHYGPASRLLLPPQSDKNASIPENLDGSKYQTKSNMNTSWSMNTMNRSMNISWSMDTNWSMNASWSMNKNWSMNTIVRWCLGVLLLKLTISDNWCFHVSELQFHL